MLELFGFDGLERAKIPTASAGDIIVFSGIDDLAISDTLCPRDRTGGAARAGRRRTDDQHDVPGQQIAVRRQDGKFLTSRQISERLDQELKHNVALRVDPTEDPDKFRVSGSRRVAPVRADRNDASRGFRAGGVAARGHHARRDGVRQEPWEQLTVDFEEAYQGAVMTRLASRKGELLSIVPDGKGRVRLDYRIPTRGLIGFRTEFLTATSGTGLIYHVFEQYDRTCRKSSGSATTAY